MRSFSTDDVTDALADERERVQHFLSDEIADVVNWVAARREDERAEEGIVCPPSCTFAERLLAFVISNLRSRELWPPKTLRGQSLQAVWRALEDDAWMRRRLDSEITVCDARRCVGNGFDDEDDTNSVENLAPLIEIARGKSQAMIKLLCYECVRNGKIMDADCKHRKA